MGTIIVMAVGAQVCSIASTCKIRGMNYAGWSETAYSNDASNESLDNLRNTGCDWVAINTIWFQENISSTVIIPRYNRYSVSESSVIDAIQYAHSIGLKVMLKPMVDCNDGTWRGRINPSVAWFTAYTDFMSIWAEIAQNYQVEMLCIGCEYANTNNPDSGDWSGSWLGVAQSIRAIYDGPLTYAANPEEEKNITWWDAMNVIGVNPYYSLTELNDPTEQQLQDAWQQKVDDMETWLFATYPDKEIIFTEIGYRSYDGTNQEPWITGPHDTNSLDFQEQVDCYKALLDQSQDRSWWRGVFWWVWETDPNAGLPGSWPYTSHTPQNKPAETLLNNYYVYCNGFSRGDLNRDFWVDVNDLRLLSAQFLANKPSADIDPIPAGDGIINLRDFAALAQNWRTVLQSDINNDTHVDFEDIVLLADQWLWEGDCGGIPEDIFEDGRVNLRDFAIIAKMWLSQ
jgi:hypothetical protein